MHNGVYQALNLDRRMESYDPEGEKGFRHLLKMLKESSMMGGICVTIPYKQEAFQAADSLSPEASEVGAVNYLRRESDGSLSGTNTDYFGFVSSLKRDLNISLKDKEVLICGTGGVARAFIVACQQEGEIGRAHV
jgi:shikimate 5-dehydrogenase